MQHHKLHMPNGQCCSESRRQDTKITDPTVVQLAIFLSQCWIKAASSTKSQYVDIKISICQLLHKLFFVFIMIICARYSCNYAQTWNGPSQERWSTNTVCRQFMFQDFYNSKEAQVTRETALIMIAKISMMNWKILNISNCMLRNLAKNMII